MLPRKAGFRKLKQPAFLFLTRVDVSASTETWESGKPVQLHRMEEKLLPHKSAIKSSQKTRKVPAFLPHTFQTFRLLPLSRTAVDRSFLIISLYTNVLTSQGTRRGGVNKELPGVKEE